MRRRFALTKHVNGQWCRRVDGKLRYFGTEYDTALRKWYEAAHLRSGEPVAEVARRWLRWKETQSLSNHTLEGYRWGADMVQSWFGDNRWTASIEPSEVERFVSGAGGVWRRRNLIVMFRSMISWGSEMGYCERPRGMKLWKGPSERELRRARRGERALWRPEEIRQLASAGTLRGRLMALCGINLGYGTGDLCSSPHVEDEYVGGPRPKTGVPRLGWLWPETRALWEECGGLPMGRPRSGHVYVLWQRHVEACGVDPLCRRHYDLRATLRTMMSDGMDVEAARLVMGHESNGVERFYLRRIARERVRTLLQDVRTLIFPPGPPVP